MVHFVRRHEKDGEVTDGRKMCPRFLVWMGPCERRRIGMGQTLGDAGMLLCENAEDLVLARKQASVRGGGPAGLEGVRPSGRQARAQPEQRADVPRQGDRATRPGGSPGRAAARTSGLPTGHPRGVWRIRGSSCRRGGHAGARAASFLGRFTHCGGRGPTPTRRFSPAGVSHRTSEREPASSGSPGARGYPRSTAAPMPRIPCGPRPASAGRRPVLPQVSASGRPSVP